MYVKTKETFYVTLGLVSFKKQTLVNFSIAHVNQIKLLKNYVVIPHLPLNVQLFKTSFFLFFLYTFSSLRISAKIGNQQLKPISFPLRSLIVFKKFFFSFVERLEDIQIQMLFFYDIFFS